MEGGIQHHCHHAIMSWRFHQKINLIFWTTDFENRLDICSDQLAWYWLTDLLAKASEQHVQILPHTNLIREGSFDILRVSADSDDALYLRLQYFNVRISPRMTFLPVMAVTKILPRPLRHLGPRREQVARWYLRLWVAWHHGVQVLSTPHARLSSVAHIADVMPIYLGSST